MEEFYLVYLAGGTAIAVSKEMFTEIISKSYGDVPAYGYLLPEEEFTDMFEGFKTKVIRYTVRYATDDKIVYRVGAEYHMEKREEG